MDIQILRTDGRAVFIGWLHCREAAHRGVPQPRWALRHPCRACCRRAELRRGRGSSRVLGRADVISLGFQKRSMTRIASTVVRGGDIGQLPTKVGGEGVAPRPGRPRWPPAGSA
jgi:hypothetical protein